MGETDDDAVGAGEAVGLGGIDGDSVGLAVGTVSANSSSFEIAGSNRTMPAPSGGTDSTVQPGPLGPAGAHVVDER